MGQKIMGGRVWLRIVLLCALTACVFGQTNAYADGTAAQKTASHTVVLGIDLSNLGAEIMQVIWGGLKNVPVPVQSSQQK